MPDETKEGKNPYTVEGPWQCERRWVEERKLQCLLQVTGGRNSPLSGFPAYSPLHSYKHCPSLRLPVLDVLLDLSPPSPSLRCRFAL
jgi:hypothetical protein